MSSSTPSQEFHSEFKNNRSMRSQNLSLCRRSAEKTRAQTRTRQSTSVWKGRKNVSNQQRPSSSYLSKQDSVAVATRTHRKMKQLFVTAGSRRSIHESPVGVEERRCRICGVTLDWASLMTSHLRTVHLMTSYKHRVMRLLRHSAVSKQGIQNTDVIAGKLLNKKKVE